ncbi:MAG: hydrolase [Alphaproteobacteria bacterium]|nr:hydrolase [Alphaproteobacteria bacterium]
MLIEASKACLLIVDMQEKLLPVIDEAERVADNCVLLLQAAEKLDLPIIVSEQYPKGLGPTIQELEHRSAMIFDKLSFSVWRNEELKSHFTKMEESGFKHVIICGVEAHVCVLQSALDLAKAGFEVFVVADAVSSRAPESVDLALARMRAQGVHVINVEMAVFELAGKAGTPEFKALSALIK